jgi:hypothetical protein
MVDQISDQNTSMLFLSVFRLFIRKSTHRKWTKALRFRKAFVVVQTCKPGSVSAGNACLWYPPFLWDCDHSQPLATYPLREPKLPANNRLLRHATYLVFQHLWFAPHNITAVRVSSYLTISPLLVLLAEKISGMFLLHFPSPGNFSPGAFPLGSRLFYVARTFLPFIITMKQRRISL